MALLSYNLIKEILDVAETYAADEKKRLGQLDPPEDEDAAPEPEPTPAQAVGMLAERLFVVSGQEGSGAYVKIGFATIEQASLAHMLLAEMPLEPSE